jgi:cytoskeletal protein CcmA (bactofilin family)
LTVDGKFEGRIDLPEHVLVVGPNATVQADLIAKDVIIFGKVVGKVIAGQTAELRHGGSLEGDLQGARIAIQEGAFYCGRVEMTRKAAEAPAEESPMLQLVAV